MSRSRGKRVRLDELVLAQGLAESIDEARRRILAGEVLGPDRILDKPGESVSREVEIRLRGGAGHPFVGRGGVKLLGALEDLGVNPAGRTCLDLGASTGGFTDCLLQRGAARVLAVDAGRAQLHERLRQDARVMVRERTTLQELDSAELPAGLDLIVADLSFMSLRGCLESLRRIAPRPCELVLLVKPQFELPRHDIPRGGVVTSPEAHRRAVGLVAEAAVAAGFAAIGLAASRLAGTDGNREYFLHLRREVEESGTTGPPFALDRFLEQAFHL